MGTLSPTQVATSWLGVSQLVHVPSFEYPYDEEGNLIDISIIGQVKI